MRSLRSFLMVGLTSMCLLVPAFALRRAHPVAHARHRRPVLHSTRDYRRRLERRRVPRRPAAARRRVTRWRRRVVEHRHRVRRARLRRQEHPAPGISPARATEIQNALIRAGYLQHNSGRWDAAAIAALRRYQQDHHWQTRFVPDARALIALGLGPRRDQRSLYPVVADFAPPPAATGAAPAPDRDHGSYR